MKERWENATPEQREQIKQRLREKQKKKKKDAEDD
jgi:hypothetical protein